MRTETDKKRIERQNQAMSFYEKYDVHNQYYIDRANFRTLLAQEIYSIKPHLSSKISCGPFFDYDKTLLVLEQDGTFLQNIESENINRKMCEIALRQNLDVIKYIPQDLLPKVFIVFDTRYKNSKDKKSDSIINALLEKIENVRWESVCNVEELFSNKEKRKRIANEFYGIYKEGNYQEDKGEFKIIKDVSSPFDRLSYDEVLINLSHCGLLLQHIPKNDRNRKMCLISVHETSEAIKYVPREYFLDVSKYVNVWDASYNKEFEFMRKYGWVEQTKSQKISL